jgi:hypothetical protein
MLSYLEVLQKVVTLYVKGTNFLKISLKFILLYIIR